MQEYDFTLCLTHDVDRVHKTYQGPYYAYKQRSPHHLTHYVTGERPYWQFDTIMELEDELGVRSSFYFLNEKHLIRDKPPREWVNPENWKLFAGRYDVTDDELGDVIRTLDRGGWEVGLHGSYESFTDRSRLRYEKNTLERVLGDTIVGGRQHYLNLERPETWTHHREIGLKYDTSLGSSTECGFDYGYDVIRPFDDEFVVFPTTIMDVALMNAHETVDGAWAECERLLERAREQGAVMTVLWHPRVFNECDFPGYAEIYERLIQRAHEMHAWIGPVDAAYANLTQATTDRR